MANNNKRYDDRIMGKVILTAKLTNETPLLIGRGSGDSVDIEVMRLPDGKPYIPGSSIAGCLHSFLKHKDDYFWGKDSKDNQKGNPLQSHIRFDDLVANSSNNDNIAVRDGVRINHQKGIAEDKGKYDYQIVEPGLEFPFKAEITLRASMGTGTNVQDFVSQIKASLESPHFRIGANTNTGFGKVICSEFKAYHFEFPNHGEAWFSFLEKEVFDIPEMPITSNPKDLGEDSFSIQATFRLKSSLMIGAYGIDGNEPDKSHLKSRDRHVLPGKSIRGAIRHRAVKIWNSLGKPLNEIDNLFGMVDEKNKIQRGRLRVEEFLFQEEEVCPMVQNRIRIDRFTGSVIDGALFNSEPVWKKGEERIKLTFTILKNAVAEEKKLLLLLLKDLWLEDLAIGGEKNVGRGILIGLEAEICNGGQKIAAFKRKGNGPELEFTFGKSEEINLLVNHQTVTA